MPNASGAPVVLTELAKRQDEIRELFVKLHQGHGIADVRVFRAVFEGRSVDDVDLKTSITKEAHDALGTFLREVTTCPPEVLAHARELLLGREQPS